MKTAEAAVETFLKRYQNVQQKKNYQRYCLAYIFEMISTLTLFCINQINITKQIKKKKKKKEKRNKKEIQNKTINNFLRSLSK